VPTPDGSALHRRRHPPPSSAPIPVSHARPRFPRLTSTVALNLDGRAHCRLPCPHPMAPTPDCHDHPRRQRQKPSTAPTPDTGFQPRRPRPALFHSFFPEDRVHPRRPRTPPAAAPTPDSDAHPLRPRPAPTGAPTPDRQAHSLRAIPLMAGVCQVFFCRLFFPFSISPRLPLPIVSNTKDQEGSASGTDGVPCEFFFRRYLYVVSCTAFLLLRGLRRVCFRVTFVNLL